MHDEGQTFVASRQKETVARVVAFGHPFRSDRGDPREVLASLPEQMLHGPVTDDQEMCAGEPLAHAEHEIDPLRRHQPPREQNDRAIQRQMKAFPRRLALERRRWTEADHVDAIRNGADAFRRYVEQCGDMAGRRRRRHDHVRGASQHGPPERRVRGSLDPLQDGQHRISNPDVLCEQDGLPGASRQGHGNSAARIDAVVNVQDIRPADELGERPPPRG